MKIIFFILLLGLCIMGLPFIGFLIQVILGVYIIYFLIKLIIAIGLTIKLIFWLLVYGIILLIGYSCYEVKGLLIAIGMIGLIEVCTQKK